MKHYTISYLLFSLILCTSNGFAQVSNGRVSSLVAAENYFAALVKEKGIRNGFLKVSDNETIIFRPDPVKAEDFYEKHSDDKSHLSWEPVYAQISRSGDWGFTTGPFVYTSADSTRTSYGQYLSVWRANKKGVWKLAIDLGVPHQKPKSMPELVFKDPKSFKYFKQLSESRLKQREDMIMTSDKLFSNTLKKNLSVADDIFLANDARLLFPGFEPVLGKENISNFYSRHGVSMLTEPVIANRALGGDLAYTYGTARITRDDVSSNYNYVRIWEVQEGFKWNVVLEIFLPE